MLLSFPSTHVGGHLAFSIDHCPAPSMRQGLSFVGSSQGPWHLTQWLEESRYSGASVNMTPDKALFGSERVLQGLSGGMAAKGSLLR